VKLSFICFFSATVVWTRGFMLSGQGTLPLEPCLQPETEFYYGAMNFQIWGVWLKDFLTNYSVSAKLIFLISWPESWTDCCGVINHAHSCRMEERGAVLGGRGMCGRSWDVWHHGVAGQSGLGIGFCPAVIMIFEEESLWSICIILKLAPCTCFDLLLVRGKAECVRCSYSNTGCWKRRSSFILPVKFVVEES
jgi:hypothetical protein